MLRTLIHTYDLTSKSTPLMHLNFVNDNNLYNQNTQARKNKKLHSQVDNTIVLFFTNLTNTLISRLLFILRDILTNTTPTK